mmetsp:Transcript_16612/g.25162  ORF Transcript_16612/g.25162 Transcript_16612/m.25162 type:complete len:200 (+) Transcript_16612:211-810(+)
MKHEAFAGMLHEAAATNKLALLTCNRDSLFGNARLFSKFTRKAYNSLVYQLATFCISRLGDYSTLMTLHLNAPLQNSPSMNTDTLALFIKFKASGRGRILVDKLGEVVFDTQGRHILSEGAKSKYHQCNNLRGAWGTWVNVNSFCAAVRLVHIMHNHAGQNYGISQACCEQAVKGTWLANSLKRPAPPLPTPSSAAPLP